MSGGNNRLHKLEKWILGWILPSASLHVFGQTLCVFDEQYTQVARVRIKIKVPSVVFNIFQKNCQGYQYQPLSASHSSFKPFTKVFWLIQFDVGVTKIQGHGWQQKIEWDQSFRRKGGVAESSWWTTRGRSFPKLHCSIGISATPSRCFWRGTSRVSGVGSWVTFLHQIFKVFLQVYWPISRFTRLVECYCWKGGLGCLPDIYNDCCRGIEFRGWPTLGIHRVYQNRATWYLSTLW